MRYKKKQNANLWNTPHFFFEDMERCPGNFRVMIKEKQPLMLYMIFDFVMSLF